jgi:hypothetical protein
VSSIQSPRPTRRPSQRPTAPKPDKAEEWGDRFGRWVGRVIGTAFPDYLYCLFLTWVVSQVITAWHVGFDVWPASILTFCAAMFLKFFATSG